MNLTKVRLLISYKIHFATQRYRAQKTQKLPNLAKRGGEYPHFGKRPNYFGFFLMKASIIDKSHRKQDISDWLFFGKVSKITK